MSGEKQMNILLQLLAGDFKVTGMKGVGSIVAEVETAQPEDNILRNVGSVFSNTLHVSRGQHVLNVGRH